MSENGGVGPQLMDAVAVEKAILRISREIEERNKDSVAELVILGIPKRGDELGKRIAAEISKHTGVSVPYGALDITLHRDDVGARTAVPHASSVPGTVDGKIVVLVDDVLFTGRSVRAAMEALTEYGRPRSVQVAILVDRGHREVSIRADFVGKNVPTEYRANVKVELAGTDGRDRVVIEPTAGNGAPAASAAATTAVPPHLVHKDLLEIHPLTATEINLILETADGMADVAKHPIKKLPTLRGRTVVNLFYEPSTRTRTSFELAAVRLGADVVNIDVGASSVKKGEALLDTARTLQAMSVDFIVMRHADAGAPHTLARNLHASVINAGDGQHEHPTQALLDLYTVRQKLGGIKGKTITLVGDLLHSRVARSNLHAFTKLGATVRFCGPPTLCPVEFEKLGAEVHYNLKEALTGSDVIYVLRLQFERHRLGLLSSVKAYTSQYGVGPAQVKWAKPGAIVMHPGPMNRGVEIAHEVADSPQAVIVDQVANGVPVRMAVLYLLEAGRSARLSTGGVA